MLATVDDLKSRVRAIGAAGTSAFSPADEAELGRLLAEASRRMIAARPERTLDVFPAHDAPPVALTFPLTWGQRVIQVPDLRSIATATIDDEPVDVAGWRLRRRPRELCALWVRLDHPCHYSRQPGELVIAGHWGPAGAQIGTAAAELAVLEEVSGAVLVWAARAWHNRTARFADTVQSPDGGVASYFRNLPPEVKLVVDSLEVPGV